MSELFTGFFDWMVALPPLYAYLAVFAIAYGENVLPPIPGDMVIVFAGYMVGLGVFNFWFVVLIATIGGAVGFMTMYVIGYRIGDAVMSPDRFRWVPKKQVLKAQHWLHRWGYGIILANRFLSGTRSVISLTVGMAQMHVTKTTVFATISSFVWVLLITWGGYKVGENWEVIGIYLRQYGQLFIALFTLFLASMGIRHLIKRQRASSERASEDTLQEIAPIDSAAKEEV